MNGFTDDEVNRAIGDMQWRVRKCYEAKGRLFEEGGRKPRRKAGRKPAAAMKAMKA